MREHRVSLQGERRSEKNPVTLGQFKKVYRLNERKFSLWLKKEVPCIIMSFRATGRRLLVERSRELPRIGANQSGSLKMSPM